ncbi:MAG: cold shock domain-containing protein [Chloroflexi bacterium]|nr:cold shock domain-containing protein [Chloroflexota bacterium]MDA8189655.1 cold shock domain-containing protein [Dehalococcoidales bacterium]
MKGTIARLVRDRGFGFIRMEDGREIFFHATGVKGATFEDLSEGQSVEFEMETDPRTGKERATNVAPA